MDVQVVIVQNLRFMREEALHQAQRDAGGFLHHVAELPGDNQLSLAGHEHRFNVKDIAAHRRPGKAGDHTLLRLGQDAVMADRAGIQLLAHALGRDLNYRVRIGGDLHGETAAQRIDPLSQAAHARFHGIIGNQGFQRLVRDRHSILGDPHGLHGFGDQVLPRDPLLFQRRIALELDDLHAVKQRLRDGVQAVGRADKQHVGQVIGYVHVVVGKGVVLLGIKYLQKGAGRAAVVGRGELVHLVEHHDRIGHAALVDAVHDTPRHGADVGTPMAADIALVMYAAEADAHIPAAQGAGDTLSDAGLARTGRADKEQDRAGLPLFEVHDGDLLDDAVLDLFQAIMILIQNMARLCKINALGLLLLP